MTYYVRNEHGHVIAKLSSMQAGRFINSFRGEWKPKSFTNGCTVNAYVVTENDKWWGTDYFSICVDKGSYIYAAC